MFKKNEKGFTLIELIVVMIIIGILVLLAMPRFANYIEQARITRIMNDIKVMETELVADYAKNQQNEWALEKPELEILDLLDKVRDRKVYSKEGLVTKVVEAYKKTGLKEVTIENTAYFQVNQEFIKTNVRTRLDKENFYVSADGVGLYLRTDGSKVNTSPETYPEVPKEFIKFTTSDDKKTITGYEFLEGYKNADLDKRNKYSLVIPSKIDGILITGIGPKAFEDMPLEGSLVLSEKIENIDDYAFSNSKFNSVRDAFSVKLRRIGKEAFSGVRIGRLEIKDGATITIYNTTFKNAIMDGGKMIVAKEAKVDILAE